MARMSGGRTSAMMVLVLAEEGLLRPERGDVALFANTTAEHPGTYGFAAAVCAELEQCHGIPAFWYEGCTVETSTRAGYTRTRAYRLVTRNPAAPEDNPICPGYRSGGEAFEEMASWSRLPSRWRRLCTTELKVQPGNELVSEWLTLGPGPAHRGHHRDTRLADPSEIGRRYTGSLGIDSRKQRVVFACAQPWARPEQNWQDFTSVPLGRPHTGPRSAADIWGKRGKARGFVSLLGLRADEPDRVKTATWRSFMAEEAGSAGCRDRIQPPGEYVYCPLSDMGINEAEVMSFWSARSYDLDVPEGSGNCVYCFLKGPPALSKLASSMPCEGGSPDHGTPVDIKWWARLESDYGRPSTTHDGSIGMFHDTSYADISSAGASESGSEMELVGTPCSCTD